MTDEELIKDIVMDKRIMYASREAGIRSFAETYSFNIESVLFNQLTSEQQKLWRKEIENAVINGGEMGLELADDKRYDKIKSSEDLEEVAKHYLYGAILYDDVYVGNPTEEDCIRCFKAGAEWQRNQMIKDAVEGKVCKGYVGNHIIVSSKDGSSSYVAFDASYANAFCIGDKVKIIIIKTE